MRPWYKISGKFYNLWTTFGNVTNNRQFVLIAAVGLDHHHDRQDDVNQPDNRVKPPKEGHENENDIQHHEGRPHKDGLKGMEADEFVLWDEQENDPTDNGQKIAK